MNDDVLKDLREAAGDEEALEWFLNAPISSPERVFAAFRSLPNAREAHADGKRGYLYVPGTRQDRCLLAAHADTYYDEAYMGAVLENRAVFRDGAYRGVNGNASIGADDRSGCAMLWLLRSSGHSLLITDGEERGQIGARYLRDSDPELFRELNGHSFILQLDRRGGSDYKLYDVPVTDEFRDYIEAETGFTRAFGSGRTDIIVLCESVCGANLSVGYVHEHHSEELLRLEEWKNTLSIVRRMLAKPLKRYPIRP